MSPLKPLSLTIILSLPIIVLAQSNVTNISKGFSDLGGLVDTFNGSVVKALATLCLTAGVTAFFFGIVQYIWGRRTGDAAKLAVGNSFMVWGLIALFVMFSVWGIVRYAQRLFGIEGNVNIIIPQVEFGSKSSSQTNTSSSPNSGGGLPSDFGKIRASDGSNCESAGNNCRSSAGLNGTCQLDFGRSSLYCNVSQPNSSAGKNNQETPFDMKQCLDGNKTQDDCNCEKRGGVSGTNGVCSLDEKPAGGGDGVSCSRVGDSCIPGYSATIGKTGSSGVCKMNSLSQLYCSPQ